MPKPKQNDPDEVSLSLEDVLVIQLIVELDRSI